MRAQPTLGNQPRFKVSSDFSIENVNKLRSGHLVKTNSVKKLNDKKYI